MNESLRQSSNKTTTPTKWDSWVEVYSGCGICESRFYIAPTKEKTHKVIRKLAQTFSKNDTQVSFKYNRTPGNLIARIA